MSVSAAARADEKVEASTEPVTDLFGRERTGQRGRQFQPQRQSVESATDLLDGGHVLGRVCVRRTGRGAGSVQEELDRWRQILTRREVAAGRKRPKGEHVFALYTHRFAARRQNTGRCAMRQDLIGQLRCELDHVLAVVEHDQQLGVADPRQQRRQNVSRGARSQVECACGGVQDSFSVTNWRQVGPPDVVGKRGCDVG